MTNHEISGRSSTNEAHPLIQRIRKKLLTRIEQNRTIRSLIRTVLAGTLNSPLKAIIEQNRSVQKTRVQRITLASAKLVKSGEKSDAYANSKSNAHR